MRRTTSPDAASLSPDRLVKAILLHDETRAAAPRELGDSTRIRDEVYRMNTIIFLDTLAGEIRYALRVPARQFVRVLATSLAKKAVHLFYPADQNVIWVLKGGIGWPTRYRRR